MYRISWDKATPKDLEKLLKEGLSYKEIGDILGVTKQTVCKLVKKFNLEHCRQTGYKGTLDIDSAEVYKLKESGLTYKQIQEYMINKGVVKKCSIQVIYNRYQEEKKKRQIV